ncbi:MAG: F0F1 ATP synthase subunit C [Rickettsiales bacterium]|jgi:F-type H+-transporting ATPase subunit c|nr:F0F1 ATP synthase subunit C [Rickettsiales bacterium]
MENLVTVATLSIISATSVVALGATLTGMGESSVAKQAMQSIAQQPDESGKISSTLFISLSMIESSAIYCLLIAMILIFSNPFWNFFTKHL